MITAIQRDIGGTLSFDVPETGALSAAFVSLHDPNGAEVRAESSATADTSARTVSTTVTSEEAADTFLVHGPQYDVLRRRPVTQGVYVFQARWRYTVAGVEYRRVQLWEVRKFVAYNPLSQTLLTGYDPLIATRLWVGQTDHAKPIRLAWEQDVVGTFRAKGRDVHLCRDVDQLLEPTAFFALGRIYTGYGGQYAQAAAAYSEQGATALGQVFGRLTWYDLDEDGVPQSDEVGRPFAGLRFTR